MVNGTTRVLLIARWSDKTAHRIGLVAMKRTRMREWDRMLGHTQPQQPFMLFSRDDDRGLSVLGGADAEDGIPNLCTISGHKAM